METTSHCEMGTQGARTSDLAEGDNWDLKELRVVSRVMRWQEWGIAFEADNRHAELLIEALGPGAASHSTPVVMQGKASEDKSLLLAWEEVRLLRTHAARASYLGIDRPDIAFSAKELCRRMSCPTKADLDALQQITQCIGVQRRNASRCPEVRLN